MTDIDIWTPNPRRKVALKYSSSSVSIIEKYTWYVGSNGYVYGYLIGSGRGHRRASIHRLLLDAPKGLQVDHINGDKLDNRMENLRLCSQAENLRAKHSTKSKAGYKGVDKVNNKFRARIKLCGRIIHLGYFHTLEEAAEAYNAGALKYFGSFAVLNEVKL